MRLCLGRPDVSLLMPDAGVLWQTLYMLKLYNMTRMGIATACCHDILRICSSWRITHYFVKDCRCEMLRVCKNVMLS
jgi:hypothetical protein